MVPKRLQIVKFPPKAGMLAALQYRSSPVLHQILDCQNPNSFLYELLLMGDKLELEFGQ